MSVVEFELEPKPLFLASCFYLWCLLVIVLVGSNFGILALDYQLSAYVL